MPIVMIPFEFVATHRYVNLYMEGTAIAATEEDATNMVRDRLIEGVKRVSLPGRGAKEDLTRDNIDLAFDIKLTHVVEPRLETIGIRIFTRSYTKPDKEV